MKLIIDISKIDYEYAKNYARSNVVALMNNHEIIECVANGTPLPKGHGRLIDADHLCEEHPLAFVRDVIDEEVTVIEADKEIKNEIDN